MRKFVGTLFLVALFGCEAPPDKAATPPSPRAPLQSSASNAGQLPLNPSGPAPAGSAGRRAYGPGDIRVADCVKRSGDRGLKGTGCTTGFVIYGPYAAVPPGSEVEVQFDLQSDGKLAFATDMVAEMGRQFHAGINEQTLDSGGRRSVGYRVQFPNGTNALETRIFVKADQPTGFSISDFLLTVRPAR